jgi:hypothetical protein
MENQNRDLPDASVPGPKNAPPRSPGAPRPAGGMAAGPGTGDLLLTDAERVAVERHRAALANYQANPREWREAWPGMVRAVIAGYQRRYAAPGSEPAGPARPASTS